MLRKLPWKRIAWIAGGVFLAWIAIEILLAGNGTPPMPSNQSGITLAGGHVQGNRISTQSWSFDYQKAQMSADGATGTVDGVRNGIVLKKGKPYAKVAAEHISLDTNSLNFTALGKVHVELIKDPQHRSFDTDLVVWTNGTKLLRMDHPSYLHTHDNTVKLEKVTINFDTDQVHLGGVAGALELSQ